MNYPYFDSKTVILYMIVGVLCIFALHLVKGGAYSKRNTFNGLCLLFVVLFCFSVFRKVGLHLGGEDALGYQEGFINYFNHGLERFEDTDILFGKLTGLIRTFTANPYIYRAICYSIIIVGYIVVINELTPHGISPVPFICILIPFMRSFGSMRNSISISLFILSIVAYYNKDNIWCFVWIIASILMHRLSFAMLAIFPFFWIYDKLFLGRSRFSYFILVIAFVAVSYLLSRAVQQYVMIFSLFENTGNADNWYLTRNADVNIVHNWPMYLPYVLLFIVLLFCYNSFPKSDRVQFLVKLFTFDIIILPATLVLGLWRFSEYLYVPNLILWSILIPIVYNKFSVQSRSVIRTCCFMGFALLLYIRLLHEWEDLSIMPYLFFWQ